LVFFDIHEMPSNIQTAPINRDRPSPGDAFDLIRVHSRINRLPGFHRHDYMELFWLVEGNCQHSINGDTYPMATGDLCLLRPLIDCHRLQAIDKGGFAFINFVLPTPHFQELSQRHPEVFAWCFPTKEQAPVRRLLSVSQLEQFNTLAEQLFQYPNRAFFGEAFLFSILQSLTPGLIHRERQDAADIPEWLTRACTAIREQEYFCQGTRAFVSITGRCAEHVARATRKYLNQSPVQIVNAARMQYARKQLLMTHQPIDRIIEDCGYADVSQFYKLFRKTYGESPVRFRKNRMLKPTPDASVTGQR
jgi:AraC family transcriptional regulator, dual regulator of chb operon